MSPSRGPSPPPDSRIVAPVLTRSSDVIDVDNMSDHGRNDDDEVGDNETQSDFHKSLLSSGELKRKLERLMLDSGEKGGDRKKGGMNVDEKSNREDTVDTGEGTDGDWDVGSVRDDEASVRTTRVMLKVLFPSLVIPGLPWPKCSSPRLPLSITCDAQP